jgi:hypothetical protein
MFIFPIFRQEENIGKVLSKNSEKSSPAKGKMIIISVAQGCDDREKGKNLL